MQNCTHSRFQAEITDWSERQGFIYLTVTCLDCGAEQDITTVIDKHNWTEGDPHDE